MRRIYYLPENNLPTEYFNTRREADRAFRCREEPERIEDVDPADECNRYARMIGVVEQRALDALYHLKELVAVAPLDLLNDTVEGREVLRYLSKVDPEFLDDCRLPRRMESE